MTVGLNFLVMQRFIEVSEDDGLHFHQLGPLGRVGLVVAMSVSCILSPSQAIFLRGRTGAEHASSVAWCDLDLDLE